MIVFTWALRTVECSSPLMSEWSDDAGASRSPLFTNYRYKCVVYYFYLVQFIVQWRSQKSDTGFRSFKDKVQNYIDNKYDDDQGQRREYKRDEYSNYSLRCPVEIMEINWVLSA